MRFWIGDCSLFARCVSNNHSKWLQRRLVAFDMAGATSDCCRLCARYVYTRQQCIVLQCPFVGSHIRICTCVFSCNSAKSACINMHFGQNDLDLLCATAVTRGWDGSEIRVSTESWREKKETLPLLLSGLYRATFRSRVRHSNHWAIAVPWFKLALP